MATADGPEWKRCDEHGIRYDDHLCPLCQGQDESGDGNPGESGGPFAGVPAELTDRDRWLLYDDDRPGNKDRQPLTRSAGGLRGVSWTDDDALLSFDEARELQAEKESYGVMYILDDESPFAVIDIDRGIDDGRPKEWCPKLDPFLEETYFDLSPSGSGIHLWYRGDLPEWAADLDDEALAAGGEHEGIDVFDEARPMTVTDDPPPRLEGKRADTIAPIDDAAAEFLQDAWINLNGDEPAPWNREGDGRTPGESRSNPVPSGEFDESGDWLGEGEAREALGHIDPNVGYETWRNIGFALTDEFGESAGGRLFREWSKQGRKWDDDAPRLADEIIGRDDSGVTIGTLVYHAKAGGWEPNGAAREALRKADDLQADHAGGVVDSGGTGTAPSWKAIRDAYKDDETNTVTARRKAVTKLLSDHTYATPRDTGTIWVYRPGEGIYERQGEAHIREKLIQNLGVSATTYEIGQVLNQVRGETPIDREEFDAYSPPLVCLQNGVLNLVTRELYDHDPEYLFRIQAAVKYDPDAPTKVYRDFLNSLVAREADAKVLAELPALCLWQSHDILPAFGMLIGDGANGKGMYEKSVTALLGSDNVENIALQDLENNRFAVANLENSFANLGSDIPRAKVNDLPVVKSITGGDHIQVERKYENSYSTKIPATPIFSVNEPPTFGERGHALARRIVPVEFPYKFTDDPGEGEKQKEDESKLMERLTTDEALSGFLNLILDAGDRVRQNGDVSLPEGPAERLEKYERRADPISAFADECIENRDGAYASKADVHQAYVEYCDQNGKDPKTKGTFYRELRRSGGPTVTETQVRLGDLGDKDRVRALKNVYFTAKGRELDVDLDVTRAVNRKRGNVDLPGDGPAPGIDHENAENRGFGQKEIVDDIRRAAAFGDGATPFDELATFVAEHMGHAKADVEYWIDHMENTGDLTKAPGGYDAPEKADLSDLAD